MEPAEGLPVERAMFFREEADLDRDLAFIQSEFRAGFELVTSIDRPAVSLFGSARTSPTHRFYDLAMDTAAGFAREGFAVVTGGGPGIMEAGNRGAKEAGGLSIGFGIRLPHEQGMNPWVDLSYEFKHFYARKVCFVKASEGFVSFPGGFGTNDELFEALTLIQTGKIKHFPVVLFGSDHWEPMVEWTRETLLAEGQISREDLDLFVVTDEPDAAVRAVTDCYRGLCAHVSA
ncbi:MAG: TIGR00730 family Rossman fold protein [Actinobacteria bacterium]|nr:TIGR00730 family Rossman fold protein [Actinomycetota bacterium]